MSCAFLAHCARFRPKYILCTAFRRETISDEPIALPSVICPLFHYATAFPVFNLLTSVFIWSLRFASGISAFIKLFGIKNEYQ